LIGWVPFCLSPPTSLPSSLSSPISTSPHKPTPSPPVPAYPITTVGSSMRHAPFRASPISRCSNAAMRAPAPSVRLSALHTAPTRSTASYLTVLRVVHVCAVLTWQPDSGTPAAWRLEGRVRPEALTGAEWSEWEAAVTLDGTTTSYAFPLEPGLSYSFRLAELDKDERPAPFSQPTPLISALGWPGSRVEVIGECRMPAAAEVEGSAMSQASEDALAALKAPIFRQWHAPFHGVSSMSLESGDADMPWDSVGGSHRPPTPPSAPSLSEYLRADSWIPPESPLLSIVPTSAELALLQAQSSLVTAVRMGRQQAGFVRGLEQGQGTATTVCARVEASHSARVLSTDDGATPQLDLAKDRSTGTYFPLPVMGPTEQTGSEGQQGPRLRIELQPPGLNRHIENSHSYSEPLLGLSVLALAEALRGLRVTVVFPDTGSAAGGQDAFRKALGRPVGSHVRVGSVSGAVTRELIQEQYDFTAETVDPMDPSDVYLFAAPANSRGDAAVLAIQQAVAKVRRLHMLPLQGHVLSYPRLPHSLTATVVGRRRSQAQRGCSSILTWRTRFSRIRSASPPQTRAVTL